MKGVKGYLSDWEIAKALERELMKNADQMDILLIRDGLDHFYPFEEDRDAESARRSLDAFLENHPPKRRS